MRILLVNETARAHVGGANRMVVETIGLLERAGHEPALAYGDGGASDVTCPVFPYDRRASGQDLEREFGKILVEFAPDVVQFHHLENLGMQRLVLSRAPSCWFLHDQGWFCSGGDRMARDFTPCHRPHGVACLAWHLLQGCGGKNPLRNWRRWRWVGGFLREARAPLRFQVASAFMRQGLVENGVGTARIDLVPLFALPMAGNTASEPGLLLLPSRLVRGKGLELAIESLALRTELNWRLAVAGDGPRREALERLTHARGISARVQFLGELTPADLARWYDRACLVLHPTARPEPFGLVGPESMAHGRAVVAFAGGATEEWLQDGVNGVIVRQRTARALSQTIATLVRDEKKCATMGQAAKERWQAFRPEQFVKRLVESYERTRTGFCAARG